MERNGKTLKPANPKRRLADARNAWRKMTPEQRGEFRSWMASESLVESPPVGAK